MEPAKVVIRFADGRILKGYTNDFFPKKPAFHVGRGPSERGSQVAVDDLKAIFFVRDFEGDPDYVDRKEFTGQQSRFGKKMEITYYDGEVAVGSVLGYDPQRAGFFMVPSDDNSNNLKVFVVSAAVKHIRFL